MTNGWVTSQNRRGSQMWGTENHLLCKKPMESHEVHGLKTALLKKVGSLRGERQRRATRRRSQAVSRWTALRQEVVKLPNLRRPFLCCRSSPTGRGLSRVQQTLWVGPTHSGKEQPTKRKMAPYRVVKHKWYGKLFSCHWNQKPLVKWINPKGLNQLIYSQ